MLTRLLHACGLYLGPKDELMPAQADNPDGFWEHLGFVALNDELLNALGGAWDLPPKRDENFAHARLDPLRMKARLLVEKFDSAGLWGWKDPRNSLTLPFWQNLLPSMKTLIMVRNPLEVAHSMKERNGTSYSFGLRLWEIYNQRVMETASEQNRLVTHYDLFFEDPESELQRITNFFGLSDAKTNKAAALVTKRRRHTHFSRRRGGRSRTDPRRSRGDRALSNFGCRSIAERKKWRSPDDGSVGCEIGRGRSASWINQPPKCLRSRKDCADRAPLPRALGTSRIPSQGAGGRTQHALGASRSPLQGTDRRTPHAFGSPGRLHCRNESAASYQKHLLSRERSAWR